MTTYNSAFSDDATVRDIVENPTAVISAIQGNMQSAFIEDALLTNGGQLNSNAFDYEVVSEGDGFLADEAEYRAEFADIPVSEPTKRERKTAHMLEIAQGIEISDEMIRYNDIGKVVQSVNQLQNNIIRKAAKQFKDALDAETLKTVNVSTSWDKDESTPVKDLASAKSLLIDGSALNDYTPDTLVISKSMLASVQANDDMQRLFVGDMASQNPVFSNTVPGQYFGLNVLYSPFLPANEAYVLQAGAAGIFRDAQPFTVTDMYAENGDNGFGGSNKTYRIDAFRTRAIALTNPGAIVKLTGLAGA